MPLINPEQRFAWHMLWMLTLFVTFASPVRAEDVLRLGHNRTWSNPALLLGIANRDFAYFGVKIVEHEFTNPADIVTGIASGDLDAGAAPGGILLASVARGVKIKGVAILQGGNNPAIAYTVRTDSEIKTIQDLRGKTAGVNNYGGNYDVYLRYWLARAGLDPTKDVNILIVPVPAMVPALINKQVHIVPLAAFDQSIVAERYPGSTRTLFDFDDVMMAGIGSHDNNSIILVMSDDFVARQRNVAVRFLEGYLRAIRAMNADPRKALAGWADAVGNTALRNLRAPPTLPDDGKIYAASLQFDADQALRFGYLPAPIDVRTVVDNSLVEDAAAALK
jgi:ABC-type nitrate/sulfonate/bicarbonate transport system substrate-binding protein